jgi:arylsulfatase A-like enzyme
LAGTIEKGEVKMRVFQEMKIIEIRAVEIVMYFLCLFMVPTSLAAELQFYPIDDTYISSGSTIPFGDVDYINVKGTSYGLLKFDVSGIGAESIQSVILRLNTAGHLPLETTVHAVTDNSWEEEMAVEATAPSPGAMLMTLSGPFLAETWYDFNITSAGYVTADGTYSFALTDTSEAKARWRSKEHAGSVPVLIITTGDPLPLPGKATNPVPLNGQEEIALDYELSFIPDSNAFSHDIYFGQSPLSLEFRGNQQSITYNPEGLAYYADYYWRVDAKNSAGTTTGDVWNFKTARRVPQFIDIDLAASGKIDLDDWQVFASQWLMQGTVEADFDKSREVDLEDYNWMAQSWLYEQPSRPNILFIMSDDHAQEAIGCYNSYLKDYMYTPNIDRLAAEGMLFNNVVCNMSLCSPSRASFVTGQYAHIHGVQNLEDSLQSDSPSYIVQLHDAGYETATYGKWHMGQMPRGCDYYQVTTGQGSYFGPSLWDQNGVKHDYTNSEYASDVYTDRALDFLANRNESKPFYLGLHFKATHHPYDYPDRLRNMYNVPAGQNPFHDVFITEPNNLYEDNSIVSPNLRLGYSRQLYDPEDTTGKRAYYFQHNDEEEMPPHGADPNSRIYAAYQHMLHKYSRCSTAIDENVGRVLDYLEQEDLLDNTIIIYTSDQGYFLGQHELIDKRLMYEESLKMPFIIRYPAEVPAGTVCDELAGNVDFARTILDFVGVEPDPDMQGRSFRTVAQGQTPQDWRDAIFYRWKKGPAHWGIRTHQYKLILIGSLGDVNNTKIELYDIVADPYEMNNLANDPAYADEIQALRGRLSELIVEVNYTGET